MVNFTNIINIIKELNDDEGEDYILTGSYAVEILKNIYCSSCESILRNDSDLDFIYLGTIRYIQRPFSIQNTDGKDIRSFNIKTSNIFV